MAATTFHWAAALPRIKQTDLTPRIGKGVEESLGSPPGSYLDFELPFPGNGMCSRTVVFGRTFAVPSLTNRPDTALRSPILLCGCFAICLTPFTARVERGFYSPFPRAAG